MVRDFVLCLAAVQRCGALCAASPCDGGPVQVPTTGWPSTNLTADSWEAPLLSLPSEIKIAIKHPR